MNWTLKLITLLTGAMLGWSGEAPLPLPAQAQRYVDTLNTEIAKAEEEKRQKVNRAVDKAIKSLNNLVREAKTAQDRRAIDDEILRLEKVKEIDLLGDGLARTNPWVGEYAWHNGMVRISADGTSVLNGSGSKGTWVVSGDMLVVTWDSGKYVDTLARPNAEGVCQLTELSGRVRTVRRIGD